jgi:hypothetical protein
MPKTLHHPLQKGRRRTYDPDAVEAAVYRLQMVKYAVGVAKNSLATQINAQGAYFSSSTIGRYELNNEQSQAPAGAVTVQEPMPEDYRDAA